MARWLKREMDASAIKAPDFDGSRDGPRHLAQAGHKLSANRLIGVFATAAAILHAVMPAGAQNWPTRPVTLVVPLAAGSSPDILARILAPRMSEVLGQQVVIENLGGAGGTTGSARVARAEPDGYQMVLGNSGTHAITNTLYRRPPYNFAVDFTPVILVAEFPIILLARKDLPADNLNELPPTRRPTRPRCNSAQWEPAPPRILPACW